MATAIGCSSTARYAVVAPGAARGPIARNAGPIVARDGIAYEVFQDADKIIVRFVNRTGAPLRVTEQSVSVDAGGRTFAVDPQDVAPDQAGRVVLPPSFAVDRDRPIVVASPVDIGGIDEGGLIGTRRDVETNAATNAPVAAGAPPRGFRWPPNGQVRLRLVYDLAPTTRPTSQPTGDATTLTHEWAFRRSG